MATRLLTAAEGFTPGIGFYLSGMDEVREQVRDAVLDVARYDVFNLGEALLEGDPQHLARMLDGLRGEGAAPPLVLWTMCEEIRAIGKIITGTAGGVAHFAHLGGMVGGYLVIRSWRSRRGLL